MRPAPRLIRFCEPCVYCRSAAALQARLACRGLADKGDVADRRLRLGLDRRFTVSRAAPRRHDEAGTAVHDLLELVVRVRFAGVLGTEGDRTVEERLLNRVEQLDYVRGEAVHRHE